MTDLDLSRAWGKCIFIADSFGELARLERKAAAEQKNIEVGVRVNPDFSMDNEAASPSKFGIDEETLLQCLTHFSHIKITGIHVHIQSQVLDAEMLSDCYLNYCALAERISESAGYSISFINFGGIGTVYDMKMQKPLDLSIISQTMQDLTAKNLQDLLVETGRFTVCNSGTYCTKVIDRKGSHGKVYLIVQNAMNGFIRPAIAELLRQNVGAFPQKGQEPLYTAEASYPIQIMSQAKEVEIVDIVGNLCTSLDVLTKDIILPKADAGDIIAVANAGIYGYTLSPQAFSGHIPPRELLWEE